MLPAPLQPATTPHAPRPTHPPARPPTPTPARPPPKVDRVAQRLAASRKMRLQLSAAAVEFLAQQGYEPMYGARPVKRAVTQLLETPIARAILAEEYASEDTIEVDVDAAGGRLVLKKGPKVSAASMDAMAVGARG
jgi:hypothetical protein